MSDVPGSPESDHCTGNVQSRTPLVSAVTALDDAQLASPTEVEHHPAMASSRRAAWQDFPVNAHPTHPARPARLARLARPPTLTVSVAA